MRKLAAACLLAAAFAAVPASARAQVTFGVQAAFHDDADFGIGAVVGAPLPDLHENVRILGDFTYFFPDGGDYFEFNGNLAWDFPAPDLDFTPFVLGGLNYAHWSADDRGYAGASSDDIGLNVGGGLTFGGSLAPSVGIRAELGGGEGVVVFGSVTLGG